MVCKLASIAVKSADPVSALILECPLLFSLAVAAVSTVAVAVFRSFLFIGISLRTRFLLFCAIF
jgi:hypothetical protein